MRAMLTVLLVVAPSVGLAGCRDNCNCSPIPQDVVSFRMIDAATSLPLGIRPSVRLNGAPFPRLVCVEPSGSTAAADCVRWGIGTFGHFTLTFQVTGYQDQSADVDTGIVHEACCDAWVHKVELTVAMQCSTANGCPSPPSDMGVAGCEHPTGCNGYVHCLAACANDAACTAACDNCVSAKGKQTYRTAVLCGQYWCRGNNDLGSNDCVFVPGQPGLVDPAGAPPLTCATCQANTLAALRGATCTPPASQNCNPAPCASTAATCFADTP